MKLRQIIFAVLIMSFGSCGIPKGIVVEAKAPLHVKNGDKFLITAKIKNTSSSQHTLTSIDIGYAYLKGIAFLRVEPASKEESRFDIGDTVSYTFDLPVKAGEELEIKFYAEAVKKGDFNSEIEFSINSDFNFITKYIRTIVK